MTLLFTEPLGPVAPLVASINEVILQNELESANNKKKSKKIEEVTEDKDKTNAEKPEEPVIPTTIDTRMGNDSADDDVFV